MGHRQRALPFDLIQETRHDAALSAKHIAQPDRCHLAFGRAHLHYNQLGYSLGRSHDACRIHCFIRGKHHKSSTAMLERGTYEIVGPYHIVSDSRLRLALELGHVLVCGGVEDDIGRRIVEYPVEELRIADIAEHRRQLRAGHLARMPVLLEAIFTLNSGAPPGPQVVLDLIKPMFGDIQQNKEPGVVLPYEAT